MLNQPYQTLTENSSASRDFNLLYLIVFASLIDATYVQVNIFFIARFGSVRFAWKKSWYLLNDIWYIPRVIHHFILSILEDNRFFSALFSILVVGLLS